MLLRKEAPLIFFLAISDRLNFSLVGTARLAQIKLPTPKSAASVLYRFTRLTKRSRQGMTKIQAPEEDRFFDVGQWVGKFCGGEGFPADYHAMAKARILHIVLVMAVGTLPTVATVPPILKMLASTPLLLRYHVCTH